ncbi:hypothetical protein LTR56_020139 [Elasticomyces elasticus]|nr:hypothetical protein LTR56_020139 [Elasticomyces elasticus]KAK3633601.1 hypothetical protein LTR22_020037 [Elasticomyces elasticus]KAK5760448.1 hypothetical protein LTS12_009492 [Elasticomyces elasticus]
MADVASSKLGAVGFASRTASVFSADKGKSKLTGAPDDHKPRRTSGELSDQALSDGAAAIDPDAIGPAGPAYDHKRSKSQNHHETVSSQHPESPRSSKPSFVPIDLRPHSGSLYRPWYHTRRPGEAGIQKMLAENERLRRKLAAEIRRCEEWERRLAECNARYDSASKDLLHAMLNNARAEFADSTVQEALQALVSFNRACALELGEDGRRTVWPGRSRPTWFRRITLEWTSPPDGMASMSTGAMRFRRAWDVAHERITQCIRLMKEHNNSMDMQGCLLSQGLTGVNPPTSMYWQGCDITQVISGDLASSAIYMTGCDLNQNFHGEHSPASTNMQSCSIIQNVAGLMPLKPGEASNGYLDVVHHGGAGQMVDSLRSRHNTHSEDPGESTAIREVCTTASASSSLKVLGPLSGVRAAAILSQDPGFTILEAVHMTASTTPAPAAIAPLYISGGSALLAGGSAAAAAHAGRRSAKAADKAAVAQSTNVELAANKDRREAEEHTWKRNEENRKRLLYEAQQRERKAEWEAEQRQKQETYEAEETRKRDRHVHEIAEVGLRLRAMELDLEERRARLDAARSSGEFHRDVSYTGSAVTSSDVSTVRIVQQASAALADARSDGHQHRATERSQTRTSAIVDSSYGSNETSPAAVKRVILPDPNSKQSVTESNSRPDSQMNDKDGSMQQYNLQLSPVEVVPRGGTEVGKIMTSDDDDSKIKHVSQPSVTAPPVAPTQAVGPADVKQDPAGPRETRMAAISAHTTQPRSQVLKPDMATSSRPSSPEPTLGETGVDSILLEKIPLMHQDDAAAATLETPPVRVGSSESSSVHDWPTDMNLWTMALCNLSRSISGSSSEPESVNDWPMDVDA